MTKNVKNTAHFTPLYVNTYIPALRELRPLGIDAEDYNFLYISEQLSKKTGWVECGALNGFRFPSALKLYIGTCMGLSDNSVNYRFLKLTTLGFIIVSEDRQRFQVAEKFRVFQKADPNALSDHKAFEDRLPAPIEGEQVTVDGIKCTFERSPYFNNLQRFQSDVSEVFSTVSDVDFEHYHELIQNYYTKEKPAVATVNWVMRFKQWLTQDLQQGRLIRVSNSNPKTKIKTTDKTQKRVIVNEDIEKMTDNELLDEVALWYVKVMEPETENLSDYEEHCQNFCDFAKVALKRGVLQGKAKENALKLFTGFTVKDKKKRSENIRLLFERRKAKMRGEPPPE